MNVFSFIRGDDTLNPSQKKTREIFFYLVFGGLTTVVNLISFIIFDKIFGSQHAYVTIGSLRIDLLAYDVVNLTVAWIVAVIFAYVTNRKFVFGSKGPVIKEFIGFVTSRIATLIAFEIGTFELCILILQSGLGIDKNIVVFSAAGYTCTYLYLVKILNSVLVVIGNYVLSKLFVFRAARSGPAGADIASADSASADRNAKDGESEKHGE